MRAELDGAHLGIRLRNRCPDEHGAARLRHTPADPLEPIDQRVAPRLVDLTYLVREVGRLVDGDRGCDLDGLKHPVVEIALQLHERLHDLSVAEQERAAPPRHREALRHRIQLHCAFERTFGLENAGRLMAVEADVGVGVVMHHDHLVLAAEIDHALHERKINSCARRIVRERNHEHARLRPADVPRGFQAVHEVVGEVLAFGRIRQKLHRDLAEVGAGEQRAIHVDRVARAGHDGGITAVEQHPHQVAEPFLGSDRVGDLQFGVELHTPLRLVVAGDRLAKLWETAAERVAVIPRVLCRFGQLVDRDLRGGNVGVAESEVDDVGSGSTCLDLESIDDGKDVRRQILDPTEVHGLEAIAVVRGGPCVKRCG